LVLKTASRDAEEVIQVSLHLSSWDSISSDNVIVWRTDLGLLAVLKQSSEVNKLA
jgi:hypothetical protein